MPCTMRAMAWSGNIGKLLLAETEEIEIGGVAEVEELEVILPGLVAKLDRAIVIFEQRRRVVQATSFENPFHAGPCRAALRIAALPIRR